MTDRDPRPRTRIAPAKVNLTLAVTGRRPDGYHELRSVFLRIGLRDRLSVDAADPEHDTDRLTVVGDPAVPVEGNLVLRAAAVVRDLVGRPLEPLDFRLEKHIPVGGGLAGGSSDAAAALRLAIDHWGLSVPRGSLDAIALQLGADVPFFVAGQPAAVVGGVGEQVRPLPAVAGGLALLLVTPPEATATARVFAELDRQGASPRRESLEATEALAEAFGAGIDGATLAGWAARLRDANDLWQAAATVTPRLAEVRAAMEELLERPALLTGSGSTLFSLYASGKEAGIADHALRGRADPRLSGCAVIAVDELEPQPVWREA